MISYWQSLNGVLFRLRLDIIITVIVNSQLSGNVDLNYSNLDRDLEVNDANKMKEFRKY